MLNFNFQKINSLTFWNILQVIILIIKKKYYLKLCRSLAESLFVIVIDFFWFELKTFKIQIFLSQHILNDSNLKQKHAFYGLYTQLKKDKVSKI